MLARALYVADDITFVAEQRGSSAFETPEVENDFGALLDRLARSAAVHELHEMSLYLDRTVALRVGFPAELPRTTALCEKHPTMTAARERGWRVNRVRRWMTFERDNTPTLHIGLAHWQRQDKNPLWDNDPAAAAYLLWRFHNISGHAYHASPGVMGTILLKALYPNNTVTWHAQYPDAVRDIWRTLTRTDYTFTHQPQADMLTAHQAHGRNGVYVHLYDTNRAYLAGASVAQFARGTLAHTGPTAPFDRNHAGIWRVVVPTWNHRNLPHPMGTNRRPGDDVWVTTPTLELVEQLADEGLIEFPRILDSYTAPPTRNAKGQKIPQTTRLLREWATKIDTFIQRCDLEQLDLEREKLTRAFKGLYRESVNGLWKTSKSQIFREDLYFTTDAMAGANLFRKVHLTQKAGGPVPIHIGDVDGVHFVSGKADPFEDPLNRFRIGDRLGQFSVTTYTADQWHGEFL